MGNQNWLGLRQWWDSWTLKDVFTVIYDYALEAIEKVKAPFKTLAEWVSSLNPFSGWKAPVATSADIELGRKIIREHGTNNFAPSHMRGHTNTYATGGFINHPEIALIGEAGREAVIPLENKSRGIPLWKAAGEEMGLLLGNSTNNDNRSNTMNFSPSYTITVNGGDQNTEQRFRQIIEETLADMMSQAERISFS